MMRCAWCVQVILDCPLRKELVYTVATPTFHHWRLEDRRCGLSFQSPADGRAFDRGVRKAMEDLAEGDPTTTQTHTLHALIVSSIVKQAWANYGFLQLFSP